MTVQIGDITISRVVEMEGPLMEPSMLLPDATAEGMAKHNGWLAPRFAGPIKYSPKLRQKDTAKSHLPIC